jgi:HSP20 family molecular chaperone IbpA
MEAPMPASRELSVQPKNELQQKEEKTTPAPYFVTNADIYETDEALTVVLEMPGVEKKNVSVNLEADVLRVEGRIDFSKYEGLEPVYSEYNIGHYARAFSLSDKIDQNGISAALDDGVLTLTLKKAKEALPQKIPIR